MMYVLETLSYNLRMGNISRCLGKKLRGETGFKH